MMRRAGIALSAALFLLLAMAPSARSQGLSGSIGNLSVDSDAPIHIESNSLEIDEPQSLATFVGNVRASQDDMQLKANELRVKYGAASAGSPTKLQTIDAIGNVEVRVNDQVAKGSRAHYDLDAETVTLSGDVVLSQDSNVIRGETIVVDLPTGRANMVGQVRGVFTPNRR